MRCSSSSTIPGSATAACEGRSWPQIAQIPAEARTTGVQPKHEQELACRHAGRQRGRWNGCPPGRPTDHGSLATETALSGRARCGPRLRAWLKPHCSPPALSGRNTTPGGAPRAGLQADGHRHRPKSRKAPWLPPPVTAGAARSRRGTKAGLEGRQAIQSWRGGLQA